MNYKSKLEKNCGCELDDYDIDWKRAYSTITKYGWKYYFDRATSIDEIKLSLGFLKNPVADKHILKAIKHRDTKLIGFLLTSNVNIYNQYRIINKILYIEY